MTNKGKKTIKIAGEKRVMDGFSLTESDKEQLKTLSEEFNISKSSLISLILKATKYQSVHAVLNSILTNYQVERGFKSRKNQVDFNPATASDFVPVADPSAMPINCEKPTNALQTNESEDGNNSMGIMRS